MKALILSGGTGSRLRPLTHTGAKQLIPVANKPIINYALEAIREAGISEVGIVIGETGPEVRRSLGDGSDFGLKITYIEQDAPRGLAHAVLISREFLGDEPFVMYLGDNLVRDGVKGFVDRFRADGPNALILLSRVPDPERFGVAELDGDRIIRLVEKPKVPPSDLALVGVYLFDASIHEAVRSIRPSWRNELEITDAIQYLVDQGKRVIPHLVQGWWKDTGKPEDVLEANRLILESLEPEIRGEVDEASQISGRVRIGEGTRIEGSIVRGPVIVGRNCRIQNAYLGPFTAVGDGVTVEGSEIENSVILAESVIRNLPARLDGSLLGRNVTVAHEAGKPRAVRLVLGDNSRVGIP